MSIQVPSRGDLGEVIKGLTAGQFVKATYRNGDRIEDLSREVVVTGAVSVSIGKSFDVLTVEGHVLGWRSREGYGASPTDHLYWLELLPSPFGPLSDLDRDQLRERLATFQKLAAERLRDAGQVVTDPDVEFRKALVERFKDATQVADDDSVIVDQYLVPLIEDYVRERTTALLVMMRTELADSLQKWQDAAQRTEEQQAGQKAYVEALLARERFSVLVGVVGHVRDYGSKEWKPCE